jgi:putative membrane protein
VRSILTKVVINAFAVWIATLVIPAVTVGTGSIGHRILSLLIVGALFGLINTFVKIPDGD